MSNPKPLNDQTLALGDRVFVTGYADPDHHVPGITFSGAPMEVLALSWPFLFCEWGATGGPAIVDLRVFRVSRCTDAYWQAVLACYTRSGPGLTPGVRRQQDEG